MSLGTLFLLIGLGLSLPSSAQGGETPGQCIGIIEDFEALQRVCAAEGGACADLEESIRKRAAIQGDRCNFPAELIVTDRPQPADQLVTSTDCQPPSSHPGHPDNKAFCPFALSRDGAEIHALLADHTYGKSGKSGVAGYEPVEINGYPEDHVFNRRIQECLVVGILSGPEWVTVDPTGLEERHQELGEGCRWRERDTGLQITTYEGENGDIVIAYRGTDEGRDWSDANLSLGPYELFGLGGHDFGVMLDQAKAYTEAVQKQFPGKKVSLTGHSLGGAITQVMATETGLDANTFNAPGAAKMARDYTGKNPPTCLNNHNRRKDAVGMIGTQAGFHTVYEGRSDWTIRTLTNHSMGNFAEDLTLHDLDPIEQRSHLRGQFLEGIKASSRKCKRARIEELGDKVSKPSWTNFGYGHDDRLELSSKYGKEMYKGGHETRIESYIEINDVAAVTRAAIENTTDDQRWVNSGRNVDQSRRYIYTETQGWIDLQHVVSAANSNLAAYGLATAAGVAFEVVQDYKGYDKSAYLAEDFRSNELGQEAALLSMEYDIPLSEAIEAVIRRLSPLSKSNAKSTLEQKGAI